MIIVTIWLCCIVLSVALYFILNYFSFKAYKKNNKLTVAYQFCFPVIFIVVVFCCLFMPNIIREKAKYKDFDSFLLWSEGCFKDKDIFGAVYYECEVGYAFSYDSFVVSGFALKEDNYIKHTDITHLDSQKLEDTDGGTITLVGYSIAKTDKVILVSINYGGNDFEFTVNGQVADEFSRLDSSSKSKINVVESAKEYAVIFNGCQQNINFNN